MRHGRQPDGAAWLRCTDQHRWTITTLRLSKARDASRGHPEHRAAHHRLVGIGAMLPAGFLPACAGLCGKARRWRPARRASDQGRAPWSRRSPEGRRGAWSSYVAVKLCSASSIACSNCLTPASMPASAAGLGRADGKLCLPGQPGLLLMP